MWTYTVSSSDSSGLIPRRERSTSPGRLAWLSHAGQQVTTVISNHSGSTRTGTRTIRMFKRHLPVAQPLGREGAFKLWASKHTAQSNLTTKSKVNQWRQGRGNDGTTTREVYCIDHLRWEIKLFQLSCTTCCNMYTPHVSCYSMKTVVLFYTTYK